jgi:hypothetical protein
MRLATSLRFTFEWERGEEVAAPELAATWARLEIWVGSNCVTRVEDANSESSRRGIYCSLYPLAEWIAYNWWFVKGHVRAAEYATWPSAAAAANGSAASRWMPHHNLRWSGDGYVWPNLSLLPEGVDTRLLWRPDIEPASNRPIRYLSAGDELVDSTVVELSLAQLVESVLTRLEERGIAETPLADEWHAIQAIDDDERAFALAAARVGADSYDLDAAVASVIEAAASRLPGPLLDEFLASVNPHRVDSGLDWIEEATGHLAALTGAPHEVFAQIHDTARAWRSQGRGLPWAIGWNQAQLVRRALNLQPDEPFRFDDMVTFDELPSGDRGLQGIGGPTASGAAGLVLGRHLAESGRRFATARALWHLGYADPSSSFLLSGLHTGRERVERAFAAELLAPAMGLADVLRDDSGLVTTEDVEDAAVHYGVSPLLVRHQIENQLATQVS